MILAVVRAAAVALRRDRAALALNFVLPIAFFTIFALVFGGRRDGTPPVRVAVADLDGGPAAAALVEGLSAEGLRVETRPSPAAAEAAVRGGEVPVALVVPAGFGRAARSPAVELLADPGDPVAPQLVAGLVEKVVLLRAPEVVARLVPIARRDVVGAGKPNPMISFYAAAIGVMFLLFTASGAGGALLDEAESGALDRVLSSRVTMGALLGGKLLYSVALAFVQLSVMFVFAWAAFRLELWPHLGGFAVMGLATSFAVAAFGILLAAVCRTRAQLGALSTLLILVMSSIGGSMFPRFLMPEAMQKAGNFTLNAWAIDGFTKVFWRDEPVASLWPEVLVLVVGGVVLFVVARRLARRWECA